jgi:3-hydroxyacyl-CoA dehydrogenase, NAD binding domain
VCGFNLDDCFSGLIGRSWSMLFASVGYKVYIYDIEPKQISSALEDISKQLKSLESSGMLRGTLNAHQQCALIQGMIINKNCKFSKKIHFSPKKKEQTVWRNA